MSGYLCYCLSLYVALPICDLLRRARPCAAECHGLHHRQRAEPQFVLDAAVQIEVRLVADDEVRDTRQDRKSTHLNSSHRCSSYAFFCLKKNRTKHKLTKPI